MSVVRAVTAKGKGRVVEVVGDIEAGQVLESSPAVALSADDRRAIDHTSLFPYYFVRPDCTPSPSLWSSSAGIQ